MSAQERRSTQVFWCEARVHEIQHVDPELIGGSQPAELKCVIPYRIPCAISHLHTGLRERCCRRVTLVSCFFRPDIERTANVEGKPWVQEPFPYQGRCLQALRISYARLGENDRARLDQILAGTGCEALVAPPGS